LLPFSDSAARFFLGILAGGGAGGGVLGASSSSSLEDESPLEEDPEEEDKSDPLPPESESISSVTVNCGCNFLKLEGAVIRKL